MANLDNFVIGQTVTARFTNCGYAYQFRGEIVGKTKNYWKVKALTSPFQTELPGRIFRIETIRSRKYSANNCIAEVVNPDIAKPV